MTTPKRPKTKAKAPSGKRAGPAKRKAAKKGKPGKPGRRPRNWARIKSKWLDSPLPTLKAFCRVNDLPYASAKRYLSVADKNNILADASEHAAKLRTRMVKAAATKDGKEYIRALGKTYEAVESVLSGALSRFEIDKGKETRWAGAGESARIVLASGAMLNQVAGELQGLPAEDETYGWPLTKGFLPLSYQRDFVLDTPDSVKFEGGPEAFCFVFIGGVGSGKTLCGAEKAGSTSWDLRGRVGMILAPTYRMLEDTTKRTFFEVLRRKDLGFRYLKTENAIILYGDTKILFRSMDDPDHLRGPSIAWAWVDEGAQMRNRDAYDIIQARIRPDVTDTALGRDDSNGRRLIFTSTPDGLNWVYDVFVRDGEQNKVKLYRGRTKDNPYLGDYHARLLATYDPRFAKQELDAEFLNVFAGQAYWNYSPIDSVISDSDLALNPNLPLRLVCDFNVSPMAWNLIQEYRQNGDLYSYVLDELHIDTASTEIAAAELLDRIGGQWKAGIEVYGDATGQHRRTSATRTDYQIIEDALERSSSPFEINIGPSNPTVSDRVAAVNARLLDARGVRKLYISNRCKHTRSDFEKVGFKPGTRQLDKDDGNLTHHTDAIGYYIANKWPIFGHTVRQQGRRPN